MTERRIYSILICVVGRKTDRSGSIAQLGEHLPYKQRVTGSSPVVPTNGPVAQLVRALACHARGRRFETVPGRHFSPKSGFVGFHIFASVAQLVEQRTENPRVAGSIPAGGTNRADVAHPVERHLAKVEVASSSLVIRSMKIWRCSFNCGAKVLWCRSQAVRQRSAKPRCPSSNLGGASKNKSTCKSKCSYFWK